MPSIESLGHPLVYKADKTTVAIPQIEHIPDTSTVRVAIRALEGMQKEAIVQYAPTGTIWRMVSDEGPYLNGTDLAPFPLAFYTAGMAFSFVEEVVKHANERHVTIQSLKITQDNYYTMEGSALRGDMTGGAKPATIAVEIEADAAPDVLTEIVQGAERTSPAQAYMRDILQNTFALNFNGVQVPVTRVHPSPKALVDDPSSLFDATQPLDASTYQPDIIVKQASAETVFNVEGGAGSSLQSEQKRTLHVRGIATIRPDGLKEVIIQLFKPIGSVFRVLSDDSDSEHAPSSLSYLAAGVGFCYMTQIGRYAHIVKQPLESYAIVQDSSYRQVDGVAIADPVDTHLYVRFNQSEEDAQKLLSMGEQTCFLHAAMRTSNPTQLTIHANGQAVAGV